MLTLGGAPGMIRTCDTRIRNPVLYPLSYGGVVVGMSGASSAADGPEVTYSTVRGRCQSIHGSISHIYISGSIASCYLLSALPGCSSDASLMVRLDDPSSSGSRCSLLMRRGQLNNKVLAVRSVIPHPAAEE